MAVIKSGTRQLQFTSTCYFYNVDISNYCRLFLMEIVLFGPKFPEGFLTCFLNWNYNREVKQNFLSNVPATDSHPNYFGISPSYLRILFLTGCALSFVT